VPQRGIRERTRDEYAGRERSGARESSGGHDRPGGWYDRLLDLSGGPERFRHRVLPGIAFALVAVLALTAWAVTSRTGSSGAGSGFTIVAPATTAAPTEDPAAAQATQAGTPSRPRARPASTVGAWATGVNGANATDANTFARFRGRSNDVVVLFTARDSWSSITNPWVGDSADHFSNFAGTWVISYPMFPDPAQGTPRAQLPAWSTDHMAACAAHQYDSYFKQIGSWLNARPNRANSFVRIGWEANGDWFSWQANDPNTYRDCFRNEALALLSVDPHARIDWTINAHTPLPNGSQGDPFRAYPGDDVVDVIGVDTYDQYPASPTVSDFDEQCGTPAPTPGLCTVISFASKHRKLFSVPEWGVVGDDTGAGRVGAAGGDNPTYIKQMAAIFKQYSSMLAYEAYFNNSDPGNVHSSLVNPNLEPRSARAYQDLWS
jgi:hypothetical protein